MRLFMSLAVLVSLAVAPAAWADPTVPTDDAPFAAYVADQFSKSFEGSTATVEPPLTLNVVVPSPFPPGGPIRDSGGRKYDLTKIHAACVQKPADCASIVTEFLNEAYANDRRIEVAFEAVFYRRPSLDTNKIMATVIDDWTMTNIVEPASGYYRRVAVKRLGGLWVGCQSDVPALPDYLVQKDLDRLFMSAESAVTQCVNNTVASQSATFNPPAPVAGDTGVLVGDNKSAVLLLHDQWATLAKQFAGELVVAAPDQNIVVYARGSDHATIQAVIARARVIRGKKVPIFDPAVYRWTETGWEVVYPSSVAQIAKP